MKQFYIREDFVNRKTVSISKWSMIIFIASLLFTIISREFNGIAFGLEKILVASVVVTGVLSFLIYLHNRTIKASFFLIDSDSLKFTYNAIICIKFNNLKEIKELRESKNGKLLRIEIYPQNKTFTGNIILTNDMFTVEAILEDLKKVNTIPQNVWSSEMLRSSIKVLVKSKQ